jgi:hypothetical protein
MWNNIPHLDFVGPDTCYSMGRVKDSTQVLNSTREKLFVHEQVVLDHLEAQAHGAVYYGECFFPTDLRLTRAPALYPLPVDPPEFNGMGSSVF